VLRAPAWLEVTENRPVRHALEVRNESFRNRDFIEMLRHHNVALVCADSVKWPRLMDVTADFVYCRLHGPKEIYASGYDGAALDTWAGRIRAWAGGEEVAETDRIASKIGRRKRDVFVFFDNDLKVSAPANALDLTRRLRT
jgi:uncharacterized protein YecE (DUF72 family)